MRQIGKCIWICIRSILILIILSFTTTSAVEHVEKDILVSEFRKNAVYQEDISTSYVKYYKIESSETKPSFDAVAGGDCYPGTAGDIVCSVQQNCVAPLVNELISFYAGGHAGYNMPVYQDYEIQAGVSQSAETTVTNSISDGTASFFSRHDWATSEYFTEVIALRVSMTEAEEKEVTSSIASKIGDPYNSTFIFNTERKSYCTDLISKSFETIGKNLNPDGFTTSVYDLIVAKDTYICYYHYIDSSGIKYVYYLG